MWALALNTVYTTVDLLFCFRTCLRLKWRTQEYSFSPSHSSFVIFMEMPIKAVELVIIAFLSGTYQVFALGVISESYWRTFYWTGQNGDLLGALTNYLIFRDLSTSSRVSSSTCHGLEDVRKFVIEYTRLQVCSDTSDSKKCFYGTRQSNVSKQL